jgi:tetratricopeptide (TPR) repeat protein
MSPVRELIVVLGISVGVLSAQSTPAREHQKKGIEYARSGQWKAAEAELRRSAALAPNDPQILAALGGVLGREHKLAEAASYLEKALALAPDNTIIRRDLARSQWQLGQLTEARRNLELVLKVTPADKQAMLLLGMVMENLGDYPAAAKLLESVPSLVRADPLAAGALARSYYRTGKTEQARAHLQSVFAQTGQPETIFAAALVAADSSDFVLAEKMFSSIRSTYPDAVNLGYNLALVQYDQEHFADCERTLSELILSGKVNGDIRNLLGWCCQKQGKTKEAIAELEAAIHLEPSREVHYLDLARIFLANANPGAALNVTRRAAQLFPTSDQVWLLQGSIEIGLQTFTDAVKSYTSAVALNKTDAEPRRALATAQWLAGMTVEAQATFQDLLRRFPRDAANYAAYGALLVGDSASSQEDVTRGVKLLETALSLDDSLAEPHYRLGNLALTKGDTESAIQHLEAAVKLNPANSKAHFALSKALKRQGRAEESARELHAYEETKAAEERSWKPPSN